MASPSSPEVLTMNNASLSLETIELPFFKGDYVEEYPDYYDSPSSAPMKYAVQSTVAQTEQILKVMRRLEEIERKYIALDDYVIGASKRFTAMASKIEQLEKDLDEERQNRLRDNQNWGTF